jgi:K+/H+ antiporter YhaU regulatory subunit KhtT
MNFFTLSLSYPEPRLKYRSMPTKKITLRERWHYWFDNLMSRGTPGLIIGLSLLTLLMLAVIALVAFLTRDGRSLGYPRLLWMGLMRTLDPGTMGGDEGTAPYLFSMLAFTVGGIFVVSTLISIVSAGLDSQIENLRKGRSVVLENNHTVILGWSSQIYSILGELEIANENQSKAAVVIMADKDRVEMEDALHARLGHHMHMKIVCRTGSPIDPNDLEIINPTQTKSIILLKNEDSPHPDSLVVKTILAITNRAAERPFPYHIVAEIHNPANLEVANMIGREHVELIYTDDLLTRLTAQTCRQSGLSVIYTELLDFEGDEIYFSAEPSLIGKTFADALMAYEDSAVMGLRREDGQIKLNPPMETVIQPGDKIIAISEDDDTVIVSGKKEIPIDETSLRPYQENPSAPERTIILGWNHRAARIIQELDAYVIPGSEVVVVADYPEAGAESEILAGKLVNQTLAFHAGDTTNRRLLDNLDLHTFDHLILLGYSDTLDAQQADAHTLVTLLHLRDISEKSGNKFSIVSEMQDMRNRELAEIARADDFIVSDKLISLNLSQISENKELALVFQDLFNSEGSEIYLKPAGNYVELGRPINFYTVVEACRRVGATALGYRVKSEADLAENGYGVHLNPDKSLMVSFAAGDRIIMLSES